MKVLAADVGGSAIKLGIVEGGRVLARTRIPAHSSRTMEDRLEAIATGWEALLAGRGLARGDCAGAALALPFLADPSKPRVRGEFGKFPGAAGVDFGQWSRGRLGLAVALENDLRAALLGEWSAGAAKGYSDAVMIALGTGIGCAAISGGKLLRGAHNRAATLFGHSSVAFDRSPGRCGNGGCAEDLASTATLPGLARAHPMFPGSALAGAAAIDYELIFLQADRGDACSRALLEHSLRVWSGLCLNAVIAFDPAILVLGGGVMRKGERVAGAVRRHLAALSPGIRLEIPVVASALGDDAALVGCECLLSRACM